MKQLNFTLPWIFIVAIKIFCMHNVNIKAKLHPINYSIEHLIHILCSNKILFVRKILSDLRNIQQKSTDIFSNYKENL